MDEVLAEFIGIFIDDGSLNIREEKHSYEFKITGNPKDEVPYFQNHVSKLASNILNKPVQAKTLDCGRSIGIYFCSKKLKNAFQLLGISGGPKSEKIKIPTKIMSNRVHSVACIRGIFDTDGCFTLKKGNSYPVITFAMKNKELLLQIKSVLTDFLINSCISFDIYYFDKRTNKYYSKYSLSINGKENVSKWFNIFGTNNPKILKKYEKYTGCKIAGSGVPSQTNNQGLNI